MCNVYMYDLAKRWQKEIGNLFEHLSRSWCRALSFSPDQPPMMWDREMYHLFLRTFRTIKWSTFLPASSVHGHVFHYPRFPFVLRIEPARHTSQLFIHSCSYFVTGEVILLLPAPRIETSTRTYETRTYSKMGDTQTKCYTWGLSVNQVSFMLALCAEIC